MNKGDKVRIKDTWDNKEWDGFEAEVIEVGHGAGPYLKPLSDRPDGCKRHEFYWPESKLELISEEKTFKVGDRVKILGTTTVFLKETVGRLGTVIAVESAFSLRVDVDDYMHGESGSVWYYDPKQVELVTEEKQTIEVGDTVKATHAESGSVVQGVVKYLETGYDGVENVEFETAAHEDLFADLYADSGWEFELIAKKEVPKPTPKVGDPWRRGLPVGTVAREDENSYSILHTGKGWVRQDGYTFLTDGHSLEGLATIVYLPPTASE